MDKHYVGEKLHKTLGEIDQIPAAEYTSWLAYFSLKNEAQTLASKGTKRLPSNADGLKRLLGGA